MYLGHVDSSLGLYVLDFGSMCQIRTDTGTSRSVRRSVYHPLSSAGQRVAWQWEGDKPGDWHIYDMDISGVLENALAQKQFLVDLSGPPFSLPYKICLNTMTQIRLETKRSRPIRRELLSMPYPPDKGTTPVSQMRGQPSFANTGQLSNSQPPGSGSGAIAVPFKKRAVSDLTGLSSCRTVATPYSLRKKHHTQPQPSAPSLSKSVSAPSQPGMTSNHMGLVTPGHLHVPSSSMSLVTSVLSNYPNFTSLQGMLPSHAHSHLNPALQNSSSMPVNLNTAASRLTSPTSSLQPAMSSVTNILVSPAVPTLQNMATWPSVPTSYSVPALRASYMSRSKSDTLGQFKGPVKIKNDATMSQRGKGTAEEVLSKYVSVITDPPKDEDCCICCEKLCQASGYCSNGNDCVVYRLERCSHMFHKLCLHEMYESGHKDGSIQCPSCKTIYGEKCGNCPKGDMEYDTIPNHLPSFPHCGTIQIKYDVRPGTQGPEHPHPGKRFTARGFPRYGFLPDTDDGRKVLKLLIVAWKRRLTFTIGQSTTTGEGDTVTWNEIHHKTEFSANTSGHGYPDPNYIENILMELAVQGVTEADLDI